MRRKDHMNAEPEPLYTGGGKARGSPTLCKNTCGNPACRKTTTSLWRKGWPSRCGALVNLCNGCGIRYRSGVLLPGSPSAPSASQNQYTKSKLSIAQSNEPAASHKRRRAGLTLIEARRRRKTQPRHPVKSNSTAHGLSAKPRLSFIKRIPLSTTEGCIDEGQVEAVVRRDASMLSTRMQLDLPASHPEDEIYNRVFGDAIYNCPTNDFPQLHAEYPSLMYEDTELALSRRAQVKRDYVKRSIIWGHCVHNCKWVLREMFMHNRGLESKEGQACDVSETMLELAKVYNLEEFYVEDMKRRQKEANNSDDPPRLEAEVDISRRLLYTEVDLLYAEVDYVTPKLTSHVCAI